MRFLAGVGVRLATSILLFMVCLIVPPQVLGDASIRYKLGGGYSASREDLLVPLAFRGGGFIAGLGYEHQVGEWTLELSAQAQLDFVFNRFGHPGALLSYEIDPTLMWSTLDLGFGELRLGFSIPVKLKNQFLYSWDDAHLYWLTTRGINLELAHRHTIASHTILQTELSLPLLTWVSRPEVYRYEKQDASLNWLGLHSPEESRSFENAGISTYQSIDLDLSILHQQSPGYWTLSYSYAHYELPRDVWVLSTSLSYSRTFKHWGSR